MGVQPVELSLITHTPTSARALPSFPRALPSFPRTREPRAIKTTVPSRPSPTPVRYRGNGVLCFTLDSRVRGNDGMRAGMTCFVFLWVPACAGMTYGLREWRVVCGNDVRNAETACVGFDLLGFGFRGIRLYSMGGLFCL